MREQVYDRQMRVLLTLPEVPTPSTSPLPRAQAALTHTPSGSGLRLRRCRDENSIPPWG